MRIRSLAALLVVAATSGAALAQTGMDVHGLKSNESGVVGDKLEPGASSFTEGQVRDKFEQMGFGEVTDLRKDDQGIWRGSARHAGKELRIGLDYKGHVAAE